MADVTKRFRILKHSVFEEKNPDGTIGRRSFSIDGAFKIGQLPVKLYIDPEEAEQLTKSTGNPFEWEAQKGRIFDEYDVTADLDLISKTVVKRKDGNKPDQAQGQLAVRCLSVAMAKAA